MDILTWTPLLVSIRAADAGPKMELKGDGTLRRATFYPGVFIGSMAFIERRTHSLGARADERVEVYGLLTRRVNSLTQG